MGRALVWQTECAMLIEIWERLRGYDKWPQTEATIRSSTLAEVEVGHTRSGTPIMETQNTCTLVWRDPKGGEQLDDFSVFESSPLFQLYEGQKVTIHCDPADPGKYFFPELQRSRAIRAMKTVLGFLVILGLLLLYIWFRLEGSISR
jgi:hypothetical protein